MLCLLSLPVVLERIEPLETEYESPLKIPVYLTTTYTGLQSPEWSQMWQPVYPWLLMVLLRLK